MKPNMLTFFELLDTASKQNEAYIDTQEVKVKLPSILILKQVVINLLNEIKISENIYTEKQFQIDVKFV